MANYSFPSKEEINKALEGHASESKIVNPDAATKEPASDTSAHSAPMLESLLGESTADTLRGAAQGATLGGADEIYGGLKGTADWLKDPAARSWYESYRAAQQDAEAANKTSAERSPWLHKGGQLAGGLASLAVPGALGMGGLAAGGAEMGTVELAAALARQGAVAGGVSGGLSSENNLDDTRKLGSDIISGAAIGSASGAAMAPLTKGAGKLVDSIKGRYFNPDTPEGVIRQGALEAGKKGLSLGKLSSAEALNKEYDAGASVASDKLNKVMELLQNKRKSIMGGASILDPRAKIGVNKAKVLLENDAVKAASGAADLRAVLQTAEERLNTGQGAHELLTDLEEIRRSSPSSVVRDIAERTADSVRASLDTATKGAYSKWNKAFSGAATAQEGVITNKAITSRNWRDMANQAEGIKKASQKGLTSKALEGGGERQGLTGIPEYFKNLAKESPDYVTPKAAEELGTAFDALKPLSAQSAAATIAEGKGINQPSGLWETLEHFVTGGSSYRGKEMQTLADIGAKRGLVGGAVNKVEQLYNLPESALKVVGENFKKVPAFANHGDALVKAIESGDLGKKQAVMFSMAQNPSMRAAMKQMLGLSDDTTSKP